MKNKITVSIAGQEYTMVAEEAENYVKRCAELVDAQVRGVIFFSSLSNVPSRSNASSLIFPAMAAASCVFDGSIVAPFAREHQRQPVRRRKKEIDGGGFLC